MILSLKKFDLINLRVSNFELRNLLYLIIDVCLVCGRKEKSSDKTNYDFILIIDVILYLIKNKKNNK